MQTRPTHVCTHIRRAQSGGPNGTAIDFRALNALAKRLTVPLQRAGPAPGEAKIMAAILVARGTHGAREACRLVPGVPNDAHSRVGTLAQRVGKLLSAAADSSTANSTAVASMIVVGGSIAVGS